MNTMPTRPFVADRGVQESGASECDAKSRHSPRSNSLVTHIQRADFPCVGAKSALAQDGLRIETAGAINTADDDGRIYRALVNWSDIGADDGPDFRSLAVMFAGPLDLDEKAFEIALWDRLSGLSAYNQASGFDCDPKFSSDPEDAHFALSFGGRAYFAVGLHPNSSRKARRLPFPTIIFNLHDQFQRLREQHRYERMREVILSRDEQFDGTPNPMVARHGEVSEARQYSGRAVDDDWTCPFSPTEAA